MIELNDISFSYGTRAVLDNLSLSVKDGEFTAVLGANGAGKSTLVKIMSGLLAPDDGEVLLNRKAVGRMAPAQLAQRRAVLEQECELTFEYSALEIVMLGLFAQSRFASSKDVEFARACLGEAGLEGFDDRIYTRLSGGEKRRVQLARALCQIGANPHGKALFLDEPSAGLDPAHAHAAMRAARALADKGCSVVAVLHDPNLAAAYADSLAFLKGGKIFAEGKVAQSFKKENLERVYGTRCEVVQTPVGEIAVFPK